MSMQAHASEVRRRVKSLPSVRQIAIAARLDPKTVSAFANGGDVRTATLDRIETAVRCLEQRAEEEAAA